MNWPYIAAFAIVALGAVGFCLMIAAFVLIAVQGGWKQAIQQPIAEGRWPLPRRLLLIGATLGTLFGIGIFILGLIPGAVPWLN